MDAHERILQRLEVNSLLENKSRDTKVEIQNLIERFTYIKGSDIVSKDIVSLLILFNDVFKELKKEIKEVKESYDIYQIS